MAGLEGQTIGSWSLRRQLGGGERGEVYLVEQAATQIQAAMRVAALPIQIPPGASGESAAGQFAQEAQRLIALKHPHVLSVLEYGQQNRRGYLVMPYISDGSLQDAFTPGQPAFRFPLPLSAPKVAGLLEQAASGLGYLHEQAILHGNLKPSNLLVSADAQGGVRLLVSDFGLLRLFSSEPGNAAATLSLLYNAPEFLIHQQPVPASDQYSLAILAYHLLTGRLPFGGDPAQVRQRHMQAAPQPLRGLNPAIPPEVESVVLRALSKDPTTRWPTVAAFAAAFREAAGHVSAVRGVAPAVHAPPVTPLVPPQPGVPSIPPQPVVLPSSPRQAVSPSPALAQPSLPPFAAPALAQPSLPPFAAPALAQPSLPPFAAQPSLPPFAAQLPLPAPSASPPVAPSAAQMQPPHWPAERPTPFPAARVGPVAEPPRSFPPAQSGQVASWPQSGSPQGQAFSASAPLPAGAPWATAPTPNGGRGPNPPPVVSYQPYPSKGAPGAPAAPGRPGRRWLVLGGGGAVAAVLAALLIVVLLSGQPKAGIAGITSRPTSTPASGSTATPPGSIPTPTGTPASGPTPVSTGGPQMVITNQFVPGIATTTSVSGTGCNVTFPRTSIQQFRVGETVLIVYTANLTQDQLDLMITVDKVDSSGAAITYFNPPKPQLCSGLHTYVAAFSTDDNVQKGPGDYKAEVLCLKCPGDPDPATIFFQVQ